MRQNVLNTLSFIRLFLWTFVSLTIVIIAQVFIASEKIDGYPRDLWSSYFSKWWAFAAPLIIVGMLLVWGSKNIESTRIKLICSLVGRIVIFVTIFALYFSLLAIG